MHRRIWGSLSRRGSRETEKAVPNGDSLEASVARGVRLFCESGGPNNSGEEVLHLPVIVEAAESSPSAATEASIRIRSFLTKGNYQRAYVQYNAIMLMRILADNPGKSFTKNIDSKFVNTVKGLLREGRDGSVQQIMRETLDTFEAQKANDETLAGLVEMWKKEKAKLARYGDTSRIAPRVERMVNQNQNQNQPNHSVLRSAGRSLPPPLQLSQRVEEAKNSAQLLTQVVQSSPPEEIMSNELAKEFVDRCQSASKSVQSYITSNNPPPDENTLLTLVETNDMLATAMSKYQRALLQARRIRGASPSPSGGPNGPFEAPSYPPGSGFPASSHKFISNNTAPQILLSPTPIAYAGSPDNTSSISDTTQQHASYPPSSAPPHREPLSQQAIQDPFADHNQEGLLASNHTIENDRPSFELQAPLAPQHYGLPPSAISKDASQAPPSGKRYSAMPNHATGYAMNQQYDGTTGEEEEIRRPAQY